MKKEEVFPAESKVEEGEFLPSKEFPDIMPDNSVLHTYWTMQEGKVYTFCIQEAAENKEGHIGSYSLYGFLHGKIYPWQLEFANLQKVFRGICRANSYEKAEVVLFDEAQNAMDAILAASKKEASAFVKANGWKLVRYVEAIYDTDKLSASWFNSRHSEMIEKVLSGRLSDKEREELAMGFDYSHVKKSEILLRKTRKMGSAQLELI